MSKGKRELIIEVNQRQLSVMDLRKELDNFLKECSVKYSEDVKFYFNSAEGNVYCVLKDRTFIYKF